MNIAILDGYIDEPSCLGVPPYISPVVRYAAGAITTAGHHWTYHTIDQLRCGKTLNGDALLVITGALVPGRYIRGMPISFNELKIIAQNFKGTTILGGSAALYGLGQGGGQQPQAAGSIVDYAATGDADAFVYDFLHGIICHRRRKPHEWRNWSIQGTVLVRYHPDFPCPLMAEIETYRGCIRFATGGCSFCLEPSFGAPEMRCVEDIVNEVKALYRWGVRNFRLGGQSCFFSYGAQGIGTREVSRPNPSKIRRLLVEIRMAAPHLQVLHIDNVNPAVMADYPKESREITTDIVKYCTAGNTAALGLESADEQVMKENNLNATPDQTRMAVAIINDIGKKRGDNGMPFFLPGINILIGLPGERKKTFTENLLFLRSIKKSGLWLRRVNIRQVVPMCLPQATVHKGNLQRFKQTVNEIINKPMLQQIVPIGTILKDVLLEIHRGRNTFGRQSGSYPLLICLPYLKDIDKWIDVKISGHGYRSVTGIEFPLNINTASLDALAQLPTIGRKRAARLIRHRPFTTYETVRESMDKTFEINNILPWISFT